jgi:ribosome-associated protein
MPQPFDLVVNQRLQIPACELRWSFTRSSGPGGQNVNKVETAVELSLDLHNAASLSADQRLRLLRRFCDGVVRVCASEHRSQYLNRQAALEKLGSLLRSALQSDPKPRKPTQPTRASQRRRVEGKKRRGEVKQTRQQRPRLEE